MLCNDPSALESFIIIGPGTMQLSLKAWWFSGWAASIDTLSLGTRVDPGSYYSLIMMSQLDGGS